MATQAKSTLSEAMAAAFAEIEAATKDSNNPHFKSKYADLSAVIDAVKPALINHGLFFTQHSHPSEDGVIVETVLGHAGGEERSLGKLYVPANKKDPQGFGSALTYARRYSLMTAFGVPTEDDDGNAASQTARSAASARHNGLIDNAQWAQIVQLVETKNVDTAKFCAWLGVSNLKEIPSAKFGDAVSALRSRPDATRVKAEPARNQQRSEELADEIPY